MPKEERIRADRALRENHLRKTIAWYNLRINNIERAIMDNMRSNDPDCGFVQKMMDEREDIKQKCKDLHRKLYG